MVGAHILFDFSLLKWTVAYAWCSPWSAPESVPHALEKNVSSAALGWRVLYTSVRLLW